MSPLKTYRLFISRAWRYDDDYYRLVNLLEQAPNFLWHNYSVPQHDPKDASNAATLSNALTNQIRPTNCVLIISGMYVAYRDWIQYEIDLAVKWRSRSLASNPAATSAYPPKSDLSPMR